MPEPIRIYDKSDDETRQKITDRVRQNQRRKEIHMRAGRSDERLRDAAQTVAKRTNTRAPEAGTEALLTYLSGHFDVAVEVLG